jgi:hypothetical protein
MDLGAVPSTSTIMHIKSFGGDIGSTSIQRTMELSVGDDRKSSKTINADENLAMAA